MAFMNDLYLSRKPMAALAVIGIAWASYFAQMPVIKADLGVSDATYGLLVLISALGAVGAMFLAPLSERLAGPFSLVVGAVGVSAGFLWVGVAAGPISFMLALGLASAGSGIIDVSSSARIAGIEARNQRPLMNLNHAFYSFCYAGAPLLTGAARVAGWSTIKVFLVLMVAILLLCFVMYGPDTHIDEDEDDVAVNGKLPTALIWITGLIVLMAFLTESSTEGWSALHIERSLGGGAGEGALGPAVLGLTMGFGRLSGHAVSKYVPDLILMATACMLSAIGIALAAAAHHSNGICRLCVGWLRHIGGWDHWHLQCWGAPCPNNCGQWRSTVPRSLGSARSLWDQLLWGSCPKGWGWRRRFS
jgi:hypothetical protein